MCKNIIKPLFLPFVLFFSLFFINIDNVWADDNCIRCTYHRVWYTGGSGNWNNIEETMQKRGADIQLVIKESSGNLTISDSKCMASVTSALGGGNGKDEECALSGIDSLNNSSDLKSHFYKNKKLVCADMNPNCSGVNTCSISYGPLKNDKFNKVDEDRDKTTVASKKTCDINNNSTGYTKDESDPLTDGISDSSDKSVDYDHKAVENIKKWGKVANKDNYTGKFSDDCSVIGDNVLIFLNNLFLIIQIISIVLFIILSSIEFIKVITGSAEEGLTKALKNTLRRVIVVIIILLLPLLIGWILDTINKNNFLTDDNGNVIIGSDGDPLCRGESYDGSSGGTVNSKTGKAVAGSVVTGVKLDRQNITLDKGKSTTLKALLLPSSAVDNHLTWTSSNKKVAKVNKNGKVTAKRVGKTTITVKTSNGLKAKCKVKVVIPVKSVKLNKKSLQIQKGKTVKLKATVSPKSATTKTLEWTSSNENVATVTKSGIVVAKEIGKTTITAKAPNGKKATCKVTVLQVNPDVVPLSLSDSDFHRVTGLNNPNYASSEGYTATQGMCRVRASDGKYYTVVSVIKGRVYSDRNSAATRMIFIDESTNKVVRTVTDYSYAHANSMTSDEEGNIYIVGDSNHTILYVLKKGYVDYAIKHGRTNRSYVKKVKLTNGIGFSTVAHYRGQLYGSKNSSLWEINISGNKLTSKRVTYYPLNKYLKNNTGLPSGATFWRDYLFVGKAHGSVNNIYVYKCTFDNGKVAAIEYKGTLSSGILKSGEIEAISARGDSLEILINHNGEEDIVYNIDPGKINIP